MCFKDRLNEAITYRNVSSYKIAKGTNVSQATLSKYRTKDAKPSAPITKLLADYLKVNYSWLMYGEGEMCNCNSGKNSKPIVETSELSAKDLLEKIESLNREIGRLQARIEILEKENEKLKLK